LLSQPCSLSCTHSAQCAVPRPAAQQMSSPLLRRLARPQRHALTQMSENQLAEPASAMAPPTEEETSQALKQTGIAVLAALVFCSGVFAFRGTEDASAWLAAYVLEESLSIDNLFVFTLIFSYFQTPSSAQPRVLRWGLIAAVVLRGLFIFGGLAVVERFEPVLLVFSGVLLYSAYGLFFEEEEEEEDLSQNAVVKYTQKYLATTPSYDGDKFFTTDPALGAPADGSALATPLLLALVCVEISDVLFAVDSVPAVFGVTTDPFIALSSNAFALLGLRALYTIIAQGIDQFHYLRPAIALVLAFIGVKLIGGFFGVEVDTILSLVVVVSTLSGGVGLSLVFPKEVEADETSS